MDLTFLCHHCGVVCTRKSVGRQEPKWCADHKTPRSRGEGSPIPAATKTCGRCREVLDQDWFVLDAGMPDGLNGRCKPCCGAPPKSRVPAFHPSRRAAPVERPRSGLSYDIANGDREGVLAFVRDRVTVTESGCWMWNQMVKKGYAVVGLDRDGKKAQMAVHRLVAEAFHGEVLQGLAVHHICAARTCVSPWHLQWVTPQANTAEMLYRRAYLQRIEALESALANLDPSHPLLEEQPIWLTDGTAALDASVYLATGTD